MRFCSVLVILGSTLLVSNKACASLIVISDPFIRNGHTYYLLESGSWTDSEAAAVSLGGHLVTINDAAENQWVIDTFAGIPATGPGTDGYLIGFTDSAQEGTFVWTSGEAVTFTNWATGEPNDFGSGEDYTMMRTNGKWNDISNAPGNQGILRGIVELNTVVPEPTTLAIWWMLSGIGLVARRWRRESRAI